MVRRLTARIAAVTALSAAMFVTLPEAYAEDEGKCECQTEEAESKLD
jgi:hypothetical protein